MIRKVRYVPWSPSSCLFAVSRIRGTVKRRYVTRKLESTILPRLGISPTVMSGFGCRIFRATRHVAPGHDSYRRSPRGRRRRGASAGCAWRDAGTLRLAARATRGLPRKVDRQATSTGMPLRGEADLTRYGFALAR